MLTLAVIAILGALATVDVIDVWNVLPWMDDHPWWREIGLGAAVAVLVPVVAGIFWGRMFQVAVIAGIGLAFLLHVTLAVVLVSSIYMLADMVIERSVSAKRLRTRAWRPRRRRRPSGGVRVHRRRSREMTLSRRSGASAP